MHEMEPKDSGDDVPEHPLVTFGREKRDVLESMAEFRRKASDSERKIKHIRRVILGDKKLTLEQVIAAITRLSPSAMDLVVLLVNSDDLEDRFEKEKNEVAAGARTIVAKTAKKAQVDKKLAYVNKICNSDFKSTDDLHKDMTEKFDKLKPEGRLKKAPARYEDVAKTYGTKERDPNTLNYSTSAVMKYVQEWKRKKD